MFILRQHDADFFRPLAGRPAHPHPSAAVGGGRGMGRKKNFFFAAGVWVVLLASACVDKKAVPPCDPLNDDSCSVSSAKPGCTRDADCGDGICQSDGTCKAKDPITQASACATVSCPAGNFCSNGKCLPANAQCQQADPACIYVPHGAFEQPAHEWWWPWATPAGPDAASPQNTYFSGFEYPDYVQVMSTPVVMRLKPADAAPAVVFNTFAGQAGATRDP